RPCTHTAPSCIFAYQHTSTPHVYPLSLHDALPIFQGLHHGAAGAAGRGGRPDPPAVRRGLRTPHRPGVLSGVLRSGGALTPGPADRKSTRLNSSHVSTSYAVFCLKKKKMCVYVASS